MRAERPVPGDLAERIACLAEAWRADADIAVLYLFGSRAGGRPTPRSDVDLAAILRGSLSADARWRKRLDLIGDACSRLGTDAVDLVVLEDVPSVLGHRVLKTHQLLFETDPRRRVEVVENVLRRYIDEAPLREAADRALAERVREGRFAR
jgi:predicted nucleotidyltransferase